MKILDKKAQFNEKVFVQSNETLKELSLSEFLVIIYKLKHSSFFSFNRVEELNFMDYKLNFTLFDLLTAIKKFGSNSFDEKRKFNVNTNSRKIIAYLMFLEYRHPHLFRFNLNYN